MFGLVPEGFELRARDFGEGGSLLAGDAFHFVEAASEFGIGFFHGEFGVDVQEAGEIDGDEKDVAEFAFDTSGGFVFLESLAEFRGFFVKFLEDAFDVVPVEADAGGFARELEAFEESREAFGDAVEVGGRFGRRRGHGGRGARVLRIACRS